MGTTRDTWPARWKTRLRKQRRWAQELKQFDWQVIEPPNADDPEAMRHVDPTSRS